MGFYFHTSDLQGARELVMRYHYSHRFPNSITFCGTFNEDGGLFGDYGVAIAACCFGIPPTRWSVPVLELQRLVRRDGEQLPLTQLVAMTCDAIRKRKAADLLVSFADAQQGHHGGIYQAASWNYDGQRDSRMDGCIIDGVFVPGRSCNSRFGTQSPEKLRAARIGRVIEPHFDVGKHLYWRALTKNGEKKARLLGLKRSPYPKPAHLPTETIAASFATEKL